MAPAWLLQWPVGFHGDKDGNVERAHEQPGIWRSVFEDPRPSEAPRSQPVTPLEAPRLACTSQQFGC